MEELLSEVTGFPTPPLPALAVLNLGTANFPGHLHTIVTCVLLATKLVTARHQRTHIAPNPSEAVEPIKTNFFHEKLLDLRCKKDLV